MLLVGVHAILVNLIREYHMKQLVAIVCAGILAGGLSACANDMRKEDMMKKDEMMKKEEMMKKDEMMKK